MSFTVNTDLWDLCQRVSVLENTSNKHNMRLNKLEDTRDDKVMPEGVDFSHTIPGKGYETATVKIDPDPSKLESNKDYALDWYINQYQNMCKEYNKVKIELDNKQKVLEMVMDQRGRYIKQFMDAENKVKEFEENIHNLTKKNQMLRGTIKNHEDRILELEEEVKYHKAFAGSAKIEECLFIIEKIKNDPLTRGEGKRWIVATCQDIQREIENKFGKLWKLSNE